MHAVRSHGCSQWGCLVGVGVPCKTKVGRGWSPLLGLESLAKKKNREIEMVMTAASPGTNRTNGMDAGGAVDQHGSGPCAVESGYDRWNHGLEMGVGQWGQHFVESGYG